MKNIFKWKLGMVALAALLAIFAFNYIKDRPPKGETATGTAEGFMGGVIEVQITMAKDKIVGVEILQAGSGMPIPQHDEAVEAAPGLIIANNSPQFDAIAGATITSQAIAKAAQRAVDKITGNVTADDEASDDDMAEDVEEIEEEDVAADSPEPVAEAPAPAPAGGKTGTATGTAEGFMGGVIEVQVTMENGKITNVRILQAGSGAPIPQHDEAVAAAPGRMIANNAPRFNAISGATVTSEAIAAAARAAVNKIQ